MAERVRTGHELTRRGFGVGAALLLVSGCFGSFGATNALYSWNERVSGNKWIRWLVFLVLIILPVYGLFILADAVVLNTIEFFTGKNPVGRTDLGKGRTLHTSRTADPNLVKHELEADGRVVRTLYVRRVSERDLRLLDERLRETGRARLRDDGSVEILDGRGRTVSEVSSEQVEHAALALESGASPTRSIAMALDERLDARLARRL